MKHETWNIKHKHQNIKYETKNVERYNNETWNIKYEIEHESKHWTKYEPKKRWHKALKPETWNQNETSNCRLWNNKTLNSKTIKHQTYQKKQTKTK